MATEARPILSIKGLKTYFFTQKGIIKAVDGVDLVLEKNDKLGIVGESGSGKSVTALSILRLVPQPPGHIVAGEILFEERNILKFKDDEMRRLRCADIAMIFQDPMVSLNPVLNIGKQIGEGIKERFGMISKPEVDKRVIEVLENVGIADASGKLGSHPHQFSGGMRQRIMIAIAISRQPRIIIADEPTTSLDVTTQAQVLTLIEDLIEKTGASLIMISHDLGVIAETCNRVAVMYGGRVVEYGDIREIFTNPLHPYSKALLNAIPRIDTDIAKLETIPGRVPDLINPPPGCRFHPRCKYTRETCKACMPELEEVEKGHLVACQLFKDAIIHGQP
jgi:peptide/nickel transport system ATP-binding protein/oligopeptide transport system ATP-binding protein